MIDCLLQDFRGREIVRIKLSVLPPKGSTLRIVGAIHANVQAQWHTDSFVIEDVCIVAGTVDGQFYENVILTVAQL